VLLNKLFSNKHIIPYQEQKVNLIQRIHGHRQSHIHDHNAAHSQDAPFWVRYYDIIVNLITLGRTRAIHRETLSLAGLRPGDSVLDIGCGTGILLLEAERVVGPDGTVVGLDVQPAMIKQARRRASDNNSRATFEIAPIDHIPYPDCTFDVAFSTLMYHHLTDTQKREGLVELERVLKPNGRLVLVDINPTRRSILTSLPGHSRLEREDYVRHEVTEGMQAAGFTVIETGAHPSKQLSYAVGQKV
jgi:ubiquinone/menaquinone biosynthesis C-methylase UbiE